MTAQSRRAALLGITLFFFFAAYFRYYERTSPRPPRFVIYGWPFCLEDTESWPEESAAAEALKGDYLGSVAFSTHQAEALFGRYDNGGGYGIPEGARIYALHDDVAKEDNYYSTLNRRLIVEIHGAYHVAWPYAVAGPPLTPGAPRAEICYDD